MSDFLTTFLSHQSVVGEKRRRWQYNTYLIPIFLPAGDQLVQDFFVATGQIVTLGYIFSQVEELPVIVS